MAEANDDLREKRNEYQREWRKSAKGRAALKRYAQDPVLKAKKQEWRQQYQHTEGFRKKYNAWRSEHRRKNRRKYFGYQMKHYYGITVAEYDTIYDRQGGCCALCGISKPRGYETTAKISGFHIDHDHATGKVRGILCGKCNVALGKYEKMAQNPKLIEYLNRQEHRA